MTSGAGSLMALVHPEIGVYHPGIVPQAGEWALGDDLAEIHHDHLVADFLDEREIVLDHDHSAPLRRDLPDGMADPRAEHGIDASHRLVEDDHARLGGGYAREFEQSLLAAAQPHGKLVLELCELEALQDDPDGCPVRLLIAPDTAGRGPAPPPRPPVRQAARPPAPTPHREGWAPPPPPGRARRS